MPPRLGARRHLEDPAGPRYASYGLRTARIAFRRAGIARFPCAAGRLIFFARLGFGDEVAAAGKGELFDRAARRLRACGIGGLPLDVQVLNQGADRRGRRGGKAQIAIRLFADLSRGARGGRGRSAPRQRRRHGHGNGRRNRSKRQSGRFPLRHTHLVLPYQNISLFCSMSFLASPSSLYTTSCRMLMFRLISIGLSGVSILTQPARATVPVISARHRPLMARLLAPVLVLFIAWARFLGAERE